VVDNVGPAPRRAIAQLDLMLRRSEGRLLVVLSSRVALPVPPRCRLEDGLLELGAADLAWSDEEAALLLDAIGAGVGPSMLRDLNAAVSGWAAGLVMLGRAVAGPEELDGPALHLLRHTTDIDDYVVSEVLDTQPSHVREFLLATSDLETLCPESVERLLGPGARRTLHEVIHGNAFVQPVYGRPHCFRYQTFFRDILAAQHAYETTTMLHVVGTDRVVPAGGPLLGEQLTPRELEVLGHLDALLTTEEMADTMFVSVNTVRTHVRSVLRKLGVDRRNAAVRLGRELGLVPWHPGAAQARLTSEPTNLSNRATAASRRPASGGSA
jgi:ATP/maltotriose-dependent transcriptional regulator MalT